jgi:hypothetical protein
VQEIVSIFNLKLFCKMTYLLTAGYQWAVQISVC